MKIFLDANYLIYLKYCADDSLFDWILSLHSQLMKKVHEGILSAFVNVLVLDEVYWILHRKYQKSWQEINDYMDRVLMGLNIATLNDSDFTNMQRFVVDFNMQPSDALHASTILRHGIDIILSEDSRFDRLPFCDRVWKEKNDKLLLR